MTTNELIETLTSITNKNMEDVKSRVSGLNDVQLQWRPSDSSWNILEVLAHLNEYARYYHHTFLKKIENTRFRNTKEGFVSSPLGRSAWKSMKLGNARNIKRKFKAPKGTNPFNDKKLLEGDQVNDFVKFQNELLTIIENASHVNLRKVKIPISISKIIRLRLGDALLFVVYHNERHVQQIMNIVNHPKFPSN